MDVAARFRSGDTIQIQMAGNSYRPERAEVPTGTTVTWINEDVLGFHGGERRGQPNAVVGAAAGSEPFFSLLLDHAETLAHAFTEPGVFENICSVHPYVRKVVTVYEESVPQHAH